MHLAVIPKTAIITLYGIFEFTRMMFGMQKAGNPFQQRMDRTLLVLDFTFLYLDEIFIYSKGGGGTPLSPHRRNELVPRGRAHGKCREVRFREGHHQFPGS